MLTEKDLQKLIENNTQILTIKDNKQKIDNYIKENQNRSQKANYNTISKDNKQIKNNINNKKKNILFKYLFTFILVLLFIIQYVLIINIVYKYK